MKKIKLLHIASDFPDHTGMNATKAVSNLLSATHNHFEHLTIAYRRIRASMIKYEVHQEYRYLQAPSLPFALCHIFITFLTAIFLLRNIKKEINSFDYIHAHKLTIDGLLAYFLNLFTGVQYVISIRADTDMKFIKNKPMSRWFFRKVYSNASEVFYVSVWGKDEIERLLKVERKNYHILPNIVETPSLLARKGNLRVNAKSEKFVFVGRLDSAKKKGLYDIIQVLKSVENFKLDIYGSANSRNVLELNKFIKEQGVSLQVNYCGAITKDELLDKMPDYCALIMPSINETFGMVYIEALYCNLPILLCKGSGIDGYLPEAGYMQKVTFGSLNQIINAMNTLYLDQSVIKNKLAIDIENGVLEIFSTHNISQFYADSFGKIK